MNKNVLRHQSKTAQLRKFGPVRAPELSGGISWLNTAQPLSLEKLRGKVVLLDFWTFCCINCMHILPDLRKLEETFPNELVVIGVHSAKFTNEKESESIRQAILRYEIQHPVVNDADFKIWESFGVRAWPTLVLIDPEGYVSNAYSGEGHLEAMQSDIQALIDAAKEDKTLKSEPLTLSLEQAKRVDMPLSFPGKVLADKAGKRLLIADSNHNRIVVASFDGTVTDVIGNGQIGRSDGTYETAQFHHPQGMAISGESLYVADTENHLIRRIDLKKKTVETVAGTGVQGYERNPSGPALKTALSSPWDLQLLGQTLYIAIAGLHQIWKLDLEKNTVDRYSGTGAERRWDGPASASAFAQPSGLATDGQLLFVADSEISSIRSVDTKSGGTVATLAGGDLFDYGDKDGTGDDVRLQHPLGVTFADGKVFIADTYNHKIKVLNPATRSVTSLVGSTSPGLEDGEKAKFFEPGGLSEADGKLYVADTNNHAVRVVDVATRKVSTLALKGLKPVSAPPVSSDEFAPNAETLTLPAQKIVPGQVGKLILDITLPGGFHFNDAIEQRYQIKISGTGTLTFAPGDLKKASKLLTFPVSVPFEAAKVGKMELEVSATFYYCREDNTGVCQIKSVIWKVPVEITASKTSDIRLQFQAKP
ncbi:MAG: redoxin domain-containing protein [Acidobacteria bacterium]|nr:redoxin domain-containing protein [Acidobacteriota bacterium]